MQSPLRISYHHCEPSEPLNALIKEKAAELDHFYPRITSCRVVVERPGYHHRQGKGAHFRVRIEVSVPGELLVVGRDPEPRKENEDAFVSVNEAFHAMRRQLQDYLRRHRGYVKAHTSPPHGRVLRIYPDQGFGFLETADGREVYFHRSSVLNGGFDRLAIGTEVRFAEEPGEKGPQASTVQPVGESGHHEFPEPD